MSLFHHTKYAGTKLTAARSALKIRDSRGVNLVKGTIELEECGSESGCALRYLYMDLCLQINGRIYKS